MNAWINFTSIVFLCASCGPAVVKSTEVDVHSKPYQNTYLKDGVRRDSVEKAPQHEEVFASIDGAVDQRLVNVEKGFGYVHTFWMTKQEILLKEYGIKWRTPAELNHHIMFD